jgi:Sec-independent protein secretion pathway component TatC
MNEVFGVVAVIGVIALFLVVMITYKKLLDGLAEKNQKAYQWVTGICTIAIFVLFMTEALFASIGIWGSAAALFLAPPWAHAFWLRDGEDHFCSEQEAKEEVENGA